MKRKNKFLVRGVTAALCAALMLSGSVSAANSYDSSVSTSTVAGVEYEYWATLYMDSSTQFRASGWITRSDSQKIPSGTSVTAQAYLYDINGDTITKTGAEEHDSGTSFAYAITSTTRSTDPVYAQGKFVVKDGGTSKTLYSYYTRAAGGTRSVSDTDTFIEELARTTLGEDNSFPVNAQGETYGSGLLASLTGEMPDLISAVGADGTLGYIRDTDIPAVQDIAVEGIQGTIPLYDVNGSTIGEFIVEESSKDYIPEVQATIQRLNSKTALAETRVALAGGGEHYQMTLAESEAMKAWVEASVPQTYDVNSYGETYGSIVGKTEEEYPDLVACRATNGQRGYCRAEEFIAAVPGMIPVYDSEGEEVLGTFLISDGHGN